MEFSTFPITFLLISLEFNMEELLIYISLSLFFSKGKVVPVLY
jgi:hypothetical protein